MISIAHDVDVAVIGAGPAGAAAALEAARRGASVHVFDPQQGAIDKPCGEGMMPSGVDVLRHLGLGDLIAQGRAFPSVQLAFAGTEPIDVRLPAPGLAVERPVLTRAIDTTLTRTPGVQRTGERARVAREGAAWRVTSRSRSVLARFIVAADGLGGGAAPWLERGHDGAGARLGLRARYVDLHARGRDVAAPVEVRLERDGEVYLTPLPGGRLNVVVLRAAGEASAGGAEADFERGLAAHPDLRERLGARVTAPEARRLTRVRPRRLARDGVFLVGDAGGGVDPILGCGVTVALESGAAAGAACARISCGADPIAAAEAYEREYRASTTRRRAVAAFLVALARHPRVARGAALFARGSAAFPRSLVSVAAGDPALVARLST